MMSTSERIQALVDEAPSLIPWVGPFDAQVLREWLELELGSAMALDEWVPHGTLHTRAVALSPVLHVVSGNTPHAAFQSVIRGLLAGCFNRVKLPSAGLPEFETWLATLPPPLASLIEARHDLPDEWLDSAAAVVFGNAATLAFFRGRLKPGIPLLEHGPKLGIAVVFEPCAAAASLVAEDVLRFDQQGCLSVQAVYVEGDAEVIENFGGELAAAMAAFRLRNPRSLPTLSESGAVSNARELARFRAANGEGLRLWESAGSTEWTVVHDPDPRLAPGPLNGFVTLHSFHGILEPGTLGPEAAFLSGVSIHPFSHATASRLETLAPPRICAVGSAQDPTLFWHHDGLLPLASLVRWRDLG